MIKRETATDVFFDLLMIATVIILLIGDVWIIQNGSDPTAEHPSSSGFGNGLSSRSIEDPSATFSPPHSHYCSDSDEDGKFDILTINVSINVSSPSIYSVIGFLNYIEEGEENSGDANDTETNFYFDSLTETNQQYLGIGNHTIFLNFSTMMIQRSNRNGVWYVTVSLFDKDNFQLIDKDSFITNNLNYSDFDNPPAILVPPFSDYGIDNNSDDKYDWLIVNVTMDIKENNSCNVTGSLFDADWSTTIDVIDYTDDFLVSNPTIQLWFNVTGYSGLEGPYPVAIKIRNSTLIYDKMIYTTSTSSFGY